MVWRLVDVRWPPFRAEKEERGPHAAKCLLQGKQNTEDNRVGKIQTSKPAG